MTAPLAACPLSRPGHDGAHYVRGFAAGPRVEACRNCGATRTVRYPRAGGLAIFGDWLPSIPAEVTA